MFCGMFCRLGFKEERGFGARACASLPRGGDRGDKRACWRWCSSLRKGWSSDGRITQPQFSWKKQKIQLVCDTDIKRIFHSRTRI